MSLNCKNKLVPIAKRLSRELRKNSTSAEEIFWQAVRNRNFLDRKFYRQYPIFFDLLGKETFFIADFYCFEEKLVVEIDGAYHERQKDYDELRTMIINHHNIKVIRFDNEQVIKNLKNVLNEIEEIINGPHPKSHNY